jgi:hypothetical protein
VLGKLGFIGIAQSAGFKLREIQELIAGIDGADGMGEKMRSLPVLKLGEVEALLDRTKAMKGWLEVAQECGCATPAECSLFPARGDEPPNAGLAPRLIRVQGKNYRRPMAAEISAAVASRVIGKSRRTAPATSWAVRSRIALAPAPSRARPLDRESVPIMLFSPLFVGCCQGV